MPLPEPESLTLTEAADRVAIRCAVKRDEAEAALERAIIRDRRLSLFDDELKSPLNHEFEGMTIDWRTGLVETRIPGGGWASRHLRMARWQLDAWITEAEPAPVELPREGSSAPNEVLPAPRRRGPKPGTVNRFGEADRALFPELDRITKQPGMTASAAALKLAEDGKVAGPGSAKSRAKRLASAYLRRELEIN
jgi:hypothetical protein